MRVVVTILALLVCEAAAKIAVITSCARMDVPFLRRVAQIGCSYSCELRSCVTGHCLKMGGRPYCQCMGCGIPLKPKSRIFLDMNEKIRSGINKIMKKLRKELNETNFFLKDFPKQKLSLN